CLVKLWDAKTLQPHQTFTGHTKGIRTLAFSDQGSLLASAGWDGRVRLWPVPQANGAALGATAADMVRRSNDQTIALGFYLQHPRPIFSVAFRHDGWKLLLGMHESNATEQDLQTGRAVEYYTIGTQHVAVYSYDDMLRAS